MVNSSRTPQPGDSSLDFSDLEEVEETQPWMPPTSDSAVEFESKPRAESQSTEEECAALPPSQADEPETPLPVEAERGLDSGRPDELVFSAEPDQISDTIVGLPAFDSPDDQATEQAAISDSGGGDPAPESDSTDDARPTIPAVVATTATVDKLSPGTREPAVAAAPRQRMLLILLASYASALTLALLWLLISSQSGAPHELESLPDVAPLSPNEFRYVPESASLPPGHTLPLGDQRQLGYVLVQPLKVTRGPVEFVHYSDRSLRKPATEPVLKLWLRFTNVSTDQFIAPLDRHLLFKREYNDLGEPELANQLVLPIQRQSSAGPKAFVLDHPETSEWDLKGQQLDHRLKPGESLETYIPTNPGGDSALSGELLWRVHLRKGYHAATGRGVTTLIEVPFHLEDVVTESAAS